MGDKHVSTPKLIEDRAAELTIALQALATILGLKFEPDQKKAARFDRFQKSRGSQLAPETSVGACPDSRAA